MARKTTTTPATRYAVMLAWVENTGLRETGRMVLRDANWFPEFEPCLEAKCAAWIYNGTDADVARAREYAAREGRSVFVYPATEPDPKNRARADVMREINAPK